MVETAGTTASKAAVVRSYARDNRSTANTAKAPVVRRAHARRAPRSRCSLRCSRRLRPPHDCPFESRPAQRPHLTPPQPRGSRSPSAHRVPRACSSRPPLAAARRHAPPHPFFISTRRRSRLFKYYIADVDLRYSLPLSLISSSVLSY
ncbi:hypothetical protein DVK07_02430 [Halorubrum sp. Atlit-26R]|nr:hypothetical protein DVK07_02430 [Halorubrum sp. Atlit-26R]